MKKHARNKSSKIHLENNHPGCMWGILHILNHHQWHHVKKRLPYRRHGRGRNSTGIAKSEIGCDSQISDPLKEQDNSQDENSAVKEKKLGLNKNSVRARLKALIIEEKSRTKGQHQRNLTSPAHLQTVPNQSKSCEKEEPDDQFLFNDETSPRILLRESGSSAAPSEKLSTSKGIEDHSEGSGRKKQFRRAFSGDLPVYEAELLDSLGLVIINEELLQKILHDRRNFSLQRLYSQKRLGNKIKLRRSGTFPSHSSSGASTPSKLRNKEENSSTNKGMDLDDACDHEERDGNSDVTFSLVPLPQLKDHRSENPTAIRRFRDIRDKIQHVMGTNRKEKQRLVMDGVLDKIPNDKRVSKEKKEELMMKWSECIINKDCHSSPRSEENYKNRKRHFKRTSSLDNSVDKYCQLFESSFNKEAKRHMSDRLKVRENEEAGLRAGREKKSLGRILSLPDLKSCSFQSMDSASEANSLEAPNRADLTEAFSRGSSFDSTNCLDSQNQLQLDAILEYDQTQERSADTESAAAEKSVLAEVSLPCIYLELQGETAPASKPSIGGAMELSPVSAFNVNSQEIIPSYETLSVLKDSELQPSRLESDALDSSPIKHQQDPSIYNSMGPEDEVDLKEAELQEGEPLDDFHQFQAHTEDAELLNYVRDILEVSGLNRPEALEAWSSSNQPVSPSVYEEVEGSLLVDPECAQNEEGGDSDHLLLFDLINEVLVDMYQESLSYWPEPLSRHCNIHRMPIAQHLLKEVWARLSSYLNIRPELDPTLDYVVSKDLEKRSGWMDLQFESECIGIELEELIFDDLLDEFI